MFAEWAARCRVSEMVVVVGRGGKSIGLTLFEVMSREGKEVVLVVVF